MSNKLCRRAIETALGAWAAARTPGLDVAWENVPFSPIAGATYLRAWLLPATTTGTDLAGDALTYRGIYQVDVVTPINDGAGTAEGIAAELVQLFKLNSLLTVDGLTMQIVSPATAARGAQDGSNYVTPVSFGYRADVTT